MPRTIHGLPGIYNSPALTLSPGDGAAIALTVQGWGAFAEQQSPKYEDGATSTATISIRPLANNPFAWSMDRSQGDFVTHTAKTTAGAVGRLFASNRNAALRYFQLHQKASACTGGETALESYEIPIGSFITMNGLDFGINGMPLAIGITWAISMTNKTYTAGATASEHNVYLGYV